MLAHRLRPPARMNETVEAQSVWLILLGLLLLAGVHVAAPSFHRLRGIPRSIWLSMAGGISVAYVFVHLLPELAHAQEEVSGSMPGAMRDALPLAERHVYVVALVGLAVFYGAERFAKRSRARHRGDKDAVSSGRGAQEHAPTASRDVFWTHMATFGIYNVIIGYLLVHGEGRTGFQLLLFATAMALHFLVTDIGLEEDHERTFRRLGRWILAAAVALGTALGFAYELPSTAIGVLVAFLAGGVILNVLKEEVPAERASRFWAFAVGMVAYTGLLLAV